MAFQKYHFLWLAIIGCCVSVSCNGRSTMLATPPTTPTRFAPVPETAELQPVTNLEPTVVIEREETETAVLPTLTPSFTPIEPYAGAPACPESLHDAHTWHNLWNAAYGCHYTHEHHANPHTLDYLFGTQIYTWAGGEISYPWQTFHGTGDHFEQPMAGDCLENDCKHAGYKWLTLENAPCGVDDDYVMIGANNCIINARVETHMIFSQADALVRFHSVWVEAQVCEFGGVNCGIYRGGGHLDLGKLNIPRGTYIPLPNDPPEFALLIPEKEPYRIHGAPEEGALDSWQSEGNHFNLIPDTPRLKVGYGVHVRDAWGGVDPSQPEVIDLTCPDFQCDRNNSEAALFRVWIIIPHEFDGSRWDTDPRSGFFSYIGYTNRYGDIVEGCTAVSLDCVPVEAIGVPVGRSRFRGTLPTTNVEYDTSPFWPDGTRDWWIEYPN